MTLAAVNWKANSTTDCVLSHVIGRNRRERSLLFDGRGHQRMVISRA
jgi:hypothetical protein